MSSLPVILVSAKTKDAASYIISELIDKEPAGELPRAPAAETALAAGRVWRIQNKYYSADVQLVASADGAPPPPSAAHPHGHLIFLAEDECRVEVCAARERAGAAAEVRVLAADTARLGGELAAWAARARLEPVPLRAPDEGGVAAVRAALHAHAWPGMRRAGRPTQEAEAEDVDDVESWSRWAEALGALGPAARDVRALTGADRFAAAEHVVAAFCRALGEDIDSL